MANNYDYDVLYIGAGHGTFDGAIPLAAKGVKVGIVEADKIGGTCPNWGCNAKIALDAPVEVVHAQKRMADLLDGGQLSVNWAGNMKHKHEVIDGLPGAIEGMIEGSGIDVLHGYGKFVDAHTVEVNGEKKTADKVVIATGLHPNRLDIPGTDLADDSKGFLALDQLPKNIAIIGSGYISMESATIANAAGANVTIFMHGDSALRQFYQPYVKELIESMKKDGINFVANANVSAFKKDGDKLSVEYGDGQSLSTDYILDATGRKPNVEGFGLDEVGVKYDDSGIIVNDHLQTSVDNIYASGDIISSKQPKLTPTAIFESTYLTQLFAGETTDPIDFPAIPSVVFTSPRIAEVGVPVAEAEKSDEYKVVKSDLAATDWYYMVDKQSIAKRALVFDKAGHIVGATEISDKADNSIDTLLPAIEMKMTKEQIGRMVYLFPSISSDVWANI